MYQPFQRQERWTKALALGSRSFVESFAQQARLSPKRRMLVTEEGFEIREDAPVFGKRAIEDKVLWGNSTGNQILQELFLLFAGRLLFLVVLVGTAEEK